MVGSSPAGCTTFKLKIEPFSPFLPRPSLFFLFRALCRAAPRYEEGDRHDPYKKPVPAKDRTATVIPKKIIEKMAWFSFGTGVYLCSESGFFLRKTRFRALSNGYFSKSTCKPTKFHPNSFAPEIGNPAQGDCVFVSCWAFL